MCNWLLFLDADSVVSEQLTDPDEALAFCPFLCEDKQCIEIKYECDQIENCRDGSDEHAGCNYGKIKIKE